MARKPDHCGCGLQMASNARPEYGWSTYDHLPLEFQTPTASGFWESDIRIPFVDYSSVCVCDMFRACRNSFLIMLKYKKKTVLIEKSVLGILKVFF